MTTAELIEHLKTLPQDLPIYINVYKDRHPMDGEGTDMSCYEPELMTLDAINVRKGYKHSYVKGEEVDRVEFSPGSN